MHPILAQQTLKTKKKLTNSRVSNKRLLILNHRVHSQLLTILSSYNSDCRLFRRSHCRHLFNHCNGIVLVLGPGKGAVVQSFNDPFLLQLLYVFEHIVLLPAVFARYVLHSHWVRVGGFYQLQEFLSCQQHGGVQCCLVR